MYGVVCDRLSHLSLGNREDISVIHFIIIIESKVSSIPIVSIFLRGCVSDVVVPSYSVSYYTYIYPAKFVSIISLQFIMGANTRIH